MLRELARDRVRSEDSKVWKMKIEIGNQEVNGEDKHKHQKRKKKALVKLNKEKNKEARLKKHKHLLIRNLKEET